jgi:hypothetical protein
MALSLQRQRRSPRFFPVLGLIVALQAANLGTIVFAYVIAGYFLAAVLPGWVGPISAVSLLALVVGGIRLVREPALGTLLMGAGLVGAAAAWSAIASLEAGPQGNLYAIGSVVLAAVGLALLAAHSRQASTEAHSVHR